MPGLLHSPNKILVATDESFGHSKAGTALHWAARNAGVGNEFHLVAVLPPAPIPLYPMAPIATVASVAHTWDEQRKQEERQAASTLRAAAHLMGEWGVPKEAVHQHIFPAAGGASGVAESIVEFTKKAHMDMVVMGTRGGGSFKKSLLSLVGLGSVSDYCIHNLHTPVIVVRPDTHVEETSGQNRVVCVAYDGSPQSDYALAWALEHLLHDGDTLHIIAVAPPAPYTVTQPTEAAGAAMSDPQQCKITDDKMSLEHAERLAGKAGRVAVQKGWSEDALVTGALALQGGVAQSIANYVKQGKVDLLVVGARGLGTFKRSMMSLMGLGSVSDHLVHNVTSCPVAVVKTPEERPGADSFCCPVAKPSAEEHAEGAALAAAAAMTAYAPFKAPAEEPAGDALAGAAAPDTGSQAEHVGPAAQEGRAAAGVMTAVTAAEAPAGEPAGQGQAPAAAALPSDAADVPGEQRPVGAASAAPTHTAAEAPAGQALA